MVYKVHIPLRELEQDCTCERKIYFSQLTEMCVYLVAHMTNLFIECMFTKMYISIFCSKMDNFDSIAKIVTGVVEWAYKQLHVKYVINWRNLKCSHKLTYNY